MSQKKFLGLTFGLMGVGLFVTSLIVSYVANSPALLDLVYSAWLFIVLAQLIFAVIAAGLSQRIGTGGLLLVYLLFCVMNGLMIAPTVLFYDQDAVTAALVAAVITFFVTAVAGALTKIDLTKLSGILIVGLLGIVVVSFFNFFLFWINPGAAYSVSWVVTYLGVGIFVLLNAVNVQQLRDLSAQLSGAGSSEAMRIAVVGALGLYVNFINIFLSLLRIFGRANR